MAYKLGDCVLIVLRNYRRLYRHTLGIFLILFLPVHGIAQTGYEFKEGDKLRVRTAASSGCSIPARFKITRRRSEACVWSAYPAKIWNPIFFNCRDATGSPSISISSKIDCSLKTGECPGSVKS